MFLITAYLIGLLLFPVKENIQNINQTIPFSWAKKVSSFLPFAQNENTRKDEISDETSVVVDDSSLACLPEIPRLKENKKDNELIIWAKEAVLLDAKSGKVLYEDNMLGDHRIASITKTMTTLVLMDIVKDWNEKVAISSYAASAGGTTVHFLSGEKFVAKDLLKAMLMNSDNTAARALAEHFGETEDKFVELMNKKASELKLRNSHFADASGLDDDNSHSCAYDVAIIAKHLLDHPMILEILQTPSHIEIVSCDEFQKAHRVGNTNELLGKYPGILGSKTGFTYSAGYCLMMMREVPGKGKVIGVVLDAGENQRWTEMQKMLDWAFEKYKWSVFP